MAKRIMDYALKASVVLGGIVLVFITLAVNFEVAVRYFFNSPTNWVADFTCYGLIYLTFLTAAWVLAADRHVKIDIILSQLSAERQRKLNLVTSIVGTLVCIVFFWYSLLNTLDAVRAHTMFITGIIFPKWPVLMIMPLGTFLLIIQFIIRTWLLTRPQKAGPSEVVSYY